MTHPSKSIAGRAASSPMARQIAAFCFQRHKKDIKFLLVTSSEGRWILPKGWPMSGKSGRDVALIEAWEEAGVREGHASQKPVLSFDGIKHSRSKGTFPTRVAAHTIEVTDLAQDFPEAEKRDRRWVTKAEAAKLVTDKTLRAAIGDLLDHVARIKKAA